MKPKFVISRCLLGVPCRYDGQSKPNQTIMDFCSQLQEGKDFITICPETTGGLTCPRSAGEIKAASTEDVLNGTAKVMSADGRDYTAEFVKGAAISCKDALNFGAEIAILKAKSPSCGVGKVYDGSFSRTLRDGDGIAATMLKQAGLLLFTENEWDDFIKLYNK